MSGGDLPAKFADNPDTPDRRRRGRPRDPIRFAVLRVYPEVKSERAICDKVAATKVAIAVATIDPGLHEWLYSRRQTVVYALGRLPQGAILEIARQLRDVGITSASEAVRLIKIVSGIFKADAEAADETDEVIAEESARPPPHTPDRA